MCECRSKSSPQWACLMDGVEPAKRDCPVGAPPPASQLMHHVRTGFARPSAGPKAVVNRGRQTLRALIEDHSADIEERLIGWQTICLESTEESERHHPLVGTRAVRSFDTEAYRAPGSEVYKNSSDSGYILTATPLKTAAYR
jgi:hypothetical protein